MGTKAGCVVDHINNIRYDNRIENLRFVNSSVNAHNRIKKKIQHLNILVFVFIEIVIMRNLPRMEKNIKLVVLKMKLLQQKHII
jgi:hypothetical protein